MVRPRGLPSWYRIRSAITKPTRLKAAPSTMHAPVTASVAGESRRLSPAQRPPGHRPPPTHWHRAGSGVVGGGFGWGLGSCHEG